MIGFGSKFKTQNQVKFNNENRWSSTRHPHLGRRLNECFQEIAKEKGLGIFLNRVDSVENQPEFRTNAFRGIAFRVTETPYDAAHLLWLGLANAPAVNPPAADRGERKEYADYKSRQKDQVIGHERLLELHWNLLEPEVSQILFKPTRQDAALDYYQKMENMQQMAVILGATVTRASRSKLLDQIDSLPKANNLKSAVKIFTLLNLYDNELAQIGAANALTEDAFCRKINNNIIGIAFKDAHQWYEENEANPVVMTKANFMTQIKRCFPGDLSHLEGFDEDTRQEPPASINAAFYQQQGDRRGQQSTPVMDVSLSAPLTPENLMLFNQLTGTLKSLNASVDRLSSTQQAGSGNVFTREGFSATQQSLASRPRSPSVASDTKSVYSSGGSRYKKQRRGGFNPQPDTNGAPAFSNLKTGGK